MAKCAGIKGMGSAAEASQRPVATTAPHTTQAAGRLATAQPARLQRAKEVGGY